MSLDVDGFTKDIDGGDVTIKVDSNHKLLKLARLLPWDDMLAVVLPKWRTPDHTKIEAFRSRLTPDTQRTLANMISQQAVKSGYANPTELDVDSTVQEANIAYPAIANLLIKVAVLASCVGKGLNQLCHGGVRHYHVGLTNHPQILWITLCVL